MPSTTLARGIAATPACRHRTCPRVELPTRRSAASRESGRRSSELERLHAASVEAAGHYPRARATLGSREALLSGPPDQHRIGSFSRIDVPSAAGVFLPSGLSPWLLSVASLRGLSPWPLAVLLRVLCCNHRGDMGRKKMTPFAKAKKLLNRMEASLPSALQEELGTTTVTDSSPPEIVETQHSSAAHSVNSITTRQRNWSSHVFIHGKTYVTSQPAPSQPAPSQPAPSQPAWSSQRTPQPQSQPAPSQPAPSQPAWSSQRTPQPQSQPAPSQPAPSQPAPSQPAWSSQRSHCLPSLEAPSSQEAPPSPVKSNIITATANSIDDLMHRLVEVRAFLKSARNLSEELEKLHSTQQMQCDILERRISQEYRRAYEMSQLSC